MTQPEPSTPQPDAARAPRDVVRHVIACNPCGESVEGLTKQEDVLRHLAAPQEHPALVEHMLGQTAKMGKYELESLLYEMGWASLKLAPEVSLHVDFSVQPRAFSAVSQHTKRMSCRVTEGQIQQILDSAPTSSPAVEDAAALSLSFADALLTLDCKRPKALLLRANALTELREFAAALSSLDEVVSTTSDPRVAVIARQGMTHAMLRSGEYEAAMTRSREFVDDYASDPLLWLNYAIAAAGHVDMHQFQTACNGFRSSLTNGSTRSTFWQQLLSAEVPWLAKKLNLAEQRVAELLAPRPMDSTS